MKSLFLLALVLVAVSSSPWDDWYSSNWTSNLSNQVATAPSGWSRNLVDGTYSSYFSDFRSIRNQYMYYNDDALIFCSPKYYLDSQTLCKKNPYYAGALADTYCIPNYYNHPEHDDVCTPQNSLYGTYQCCYLNGVQETEIPFERDMNAYDSNTAHTTPLL